MFVLLGRKVHCLGSYCRLIDCYGQATTKAADAKKTLSADLAGHMKFFFISFATPNYGVPIEGGLLEPLGSPKGFQRKDPNWREKRHPLGRLNDKKL